MRETYDASIGGRKGLLYVGYGTAEEGDTAAWTAESGTMIRFVRKDGEVPLSFDVGRLLSCDAKGRYRMIVVYEDEEGGDGGGGDGDGGEPVEKRIAIVRVHSTAVDRVIGAVLDLAERVEKERGGAEEGAGGSDVVADAGYSAAAAAATTAIAVAPPGTAEHADTDPGADTAAAESAPRQYEPPSHLKRAEGAQEAKAEP